MTSSEDGTAPSAGKLAGLEVLRFATALVVLIWHYRNFVFVGEGEPAYLPEQPFHTILRPFQSYGYAGVELFWCISGFIFAWKYGAVIRAAGLTFGRFMALRFSRLYPLHFVTLLAMAGLQFVYLQRHGQYFIYHFNDLKHFLLNLVFAQYWGFQDDYSFNSPSWSISAEILVYVLFFALSRLVGPGLWRAVAIAAGVAVLASIVRSVLGLKLAIFGAATFFYLGVITSHLQALIETRPRGEQKLYVLASLVAVAVPAALVSAGAMKIAGASLVMFPAVIVLFQFAIRGSSERLAALGDLTYACYMLQMPLQLAIVLLLEQAGVDIRRLFQTDWFFLGFIALTVAVSWPVFRGFERPMRIALRRVLLRGREGPADGRQVVGLPR